ncbi:MAG: hypothetical protein EXQ70_09315, partial [Solirubrobacterales bacterium]|nr:hypothetical protein [Solirubrobacterales bacterium]
MRAALVATDVDDSGRTPALAAGIGVSAAAGEREVILAVLRDQPRSRRPTLLATPAARGLERDLGGLGLEASARGHLCHLALAAEPDSLELLGELERGPALLLICLPHGLWPEAIRHPSLAPGAALIGVTLPRDRSLAALAVGELRAEGVRVKIAPRSLPRVAARRASAGVSPGGAASARVERLGRALLGESSRGTSARRGEAGQALPLSLGAAAALLVCTMVLATIGGAVTGKGRAQRAADLAAISSVRSMRDDAPRLLAPARLPDGSLNPRHLSRAAYLERARVAGLDAARRNGVEASRLRLAFPDRRALPPLRARAVVRGEIDPEELPGGERLERSSGRRRPIAVVASAVAEASPPGGEWSGLPGTASGGGYSGPLAYRNGE